MGLGFRNFSKNGKAVGRVRGREPCRGETVDSWGIGLPIVPTLAVGATQLSTGGRASLRRSEVRGITFVMPITNVIFWTDD